MKIEMKPVKGNVANVKKVHHCIINNSTFAHSVFILSFSVNSYFKKLKC